MTDTPRANAKPRETIRHYSGGGGGVNRFPPVDGLSPPNSESTRLIDIRTPENLDFEISSPNTVFSPGDGFTMKTLDGSSPNLSSRKLKTKKSSSSFTSLQNSPGTNKTPVQCPASQSSRSSINKSKRKGSIESEDDQPSGTVRYLGESANRSGKKKSILLNQSGTPNLKEIAEKIDFDQSTVEKASSGGGVGFSFLVGAMVLGAAGLYLSSGHGFSPEWKKIKQDFRADIDMLKSYFPSQSKGTMNQLRHALSSGFKDEPEHPGSVILMHPQSARLTAHCLVNSLSQIVHKAMKNARISGTSANTEDFTLNSTSFPSEQSGHDKFHQEMTKRLSTHKIVNLLDVHKLPPTTAHVLHGILDTSEAAHKQAAVLMTLEDFQDKVPASGCGSDEAAENILRELWASLGEDKVDALVSRVTVSVIWVQPESNIVESCPTLP